MFFVSAILLQRGFVGNALDAVSSPEIDAALAHSAEVAPNDIRALALHRLGNEARRAGRDDRPDHADAQRFAAECRSRLE